jgi:hypothetical protein
MPAAMMFIPSLGGVSHHWSEDTKEDDIILGAQNFRRRGGPHPARRAVKPPKRALIDSVIASPRVRPQAGPRINSAKQSGLAHSERDCFVAWAPRNDAVSLVLLRISRSNF